MPDQLAAVLGRASKLPTDAGPQWELLLGQARRATLASRLARHCQDSGGLDRVPERPRLHLMAAALAADRLAHGMRLEVDRIADALAAAGLRCVLMKGAAYLCADLPPARGRLFGDIDILVARDELDKAEGALLAAGWIAGQLDGYNERYYRQWMHEIPPLVHVRRGSIIDLHHAITPPTSAFHISGEQLLSAARPLDDSGRCWVLQPVDMVLHSAVHLFAEGEFDHGLRDLLDMKDLLRHFETHESDFWTALFTRSRALGLQGPLHHALHHVERLFGDCVPTAHRQAILALRPRYPKRLMMAWLLKLALRPVHPSCDTQFTGLARWLLYLRSHWLRMPMHLLVPHLARKAWMSRFPNKASMLETKTMPGGVP